jgi:hypothetical protein
MSYQLDFESVFLGLDLTFLNMNMTVFSFVVQGCWRDFLKQCLQEMRP